MELNNEDTERNNEVMADFHNVKYIMKRHFQPGKCSQKCDNVQQQKQQQQI